ncbi:MAG: transcriptional regulator [Planctomycetes bacterium]|nr:transcriptional regulator [Planctomycetota bacterium]MCP4771392.1 transcriptional regulator [Planctomycetota bacterium]MCP4861829.1 transcriptional regulator [Planctomycetota bacterium]
MFMVLGNEGADATWLLAETGLTWGNLSSHMTKLEQVGYVEVSKEFVDNKPKTMVRLTQDGRQAFLDYRQQIQDMLNMPIDE